MSAARSRMSRRAERPSDHKKCTEPVAPSSGFPIDLRRSECRSGSHQPPALRSRCTRESRGVRCVAVKRIGIGKWRNLRSIRYSSADFAGIAARRAALDVGNSRSNFAPHKKCTGAVAPSSGFLTDLRRSGCRSGDHQPQVLLPRCNHHSRGARARQVKWVLDRSFRKLRTLHRAQHEIALRA